MISRPVLPDVDKPAQFRDSAGLLVERYGLLLLPREAWHI